jgi:Domain of unknown function (DUF2382)
VPTPIPTPFGGRLASFTPTSDYPSFDLYRYVYLVRAIHDGVHPLNHRLLQPGLYIRRLFCVTLDDHLVVADEHRHCARTLASSLPQQGQRPVAKEEVRIRKEVVEDTEVVEEDVRREDVEVDDETTGRSS